MRKKPVYVILFLTLSLFPAKSFFAQDYLVDFEFLGSKTKLELLVVFGVVVENDIDLYKITYQTPDVDGLLDTASALFTLPKVNEQTLLPLVVYGHGTTNGPDDVPSRLEGGHEIPMGYAGFGFATVAPDYLGLGDARGFHPYLHAETEASASLDALFAAYEFLEFHLQADLDPNYLFLAGYSQGGHASMALHKNIDDFWSIIIPVTAATHMSGPYSLSNVMKDRILSNDPYGFPAYIAYIFLGFNEAYDLYGNIGEVFKEPYATPITSFYDGTIDLLQLNGQLLTLLSSGGNSLVKNMFQDSIRDGLENNPLHPLNIALQDNDVYEWAPDSPTRLYYCGNDQQVPPRNSILADSVMNALGAPDVQALNLNPNFDHGPCVLPSIINSITFFKSFLNTSSTDQPGQKSPLTVYPNPTSDELIVKWNSGEEIQYSIFSMKGVKVQEGIVKSTKIDIKELPDGVYVLVCTTDHETRVARIFHQ